MSRIVNPYCELNPDSPVVEQAVKKDNWPPWLHRHEGGLLCVARTFTKEVKEET